MNRELADLQDLKSAFVSHCRALGCEGKYIKVCENKFKKIETTLDKLDELEKVLNIINKNEVDVQSFKATNESMNFTYKHYLEYHQNYSYQLLTEIEFNLLKEYLK